MFKAKINAGVLKECVDAIRVIDDVVVVNISTGGWTIRAVDPANVALISFELDHNVFSDFEFEPKVLGEDKMKICVDFAELDRMLKTDLIGQEEVVELELDEQAKNLFVKCDIFEYTLSLTDFDSLRREPKLSELVFSAQAIVEADKLIRGIRAAKMVNEEEYVMLEINDGVLYLKGEDEKNMLKVARSENATVTDLKQRKHHSRYNLEYLSAMIKGLNPTEVATLKFCNDYPLSIDFEIAGGRGKVVYLLAPRLPPDEE